MSYILKFKIMFTILNFFLRYNWIKFWYNNWRTFILGPNHFVLDNFSFGLFWVFLFRLRNDFYLGNTIGNGVDHSIEEVV